MVLQITTSKLPHPTILPLHLSPACLISTRHAARRSSDRSLRIRPSDLSQEDNIIRPSRLGITLGARRPGLPFPLSEPRPASLGRLVLGAQSWAGTLASQIAEDGFLPRSLVSGAGIIRVLYKDRCACDTLLWAERPVLVSYLL